MGPLEELPPPRLSRRRSRAGVSQSQSSRRVGQCVMHNRWCSGPAATHKCDDCKRAAGHLPPEPAMDEANPGTQRGFSQPRIPASPLPSTNPAAPNPRANEYSPVSSSQSCELCRTNRPDSVPCATSCFTVQAGHCSLISDPCAPASCLLSPVSCSGASVPGAPSQMLSS